MHQALGYAVLAALLSGLLSLAPLTGSEIAVLAACFAQLPLLFVGLTMGLAAALVAAACATLIFSLMGFLEGLSYAIVQAMPVVFLVRQALLSRQDGAVTVWYPPGQILAQLVAMAAGAIVVGFLALLGQPGGLQGVVEGFLIDALAELGAVTGQPLVAEAALTGWTFLLPALFATFWLLLIVINAALAQALAVRVGWNRRPSPDMALLELPSWLWPALGAAAFLALLGDSALGFLGRSLLVVLMVPFAFLGLAVIHKWARRWSNRHLALTALYAGIIIFGWPILIVLALGLVEDWVQLRRYL